MKKFKLILAASVLIVSVLVTGCNSKNSPAPTSNTTNNNTSTNTVDANTKTDTEVNIDSLVYKIGNEESDIVIVNTQGGPSTEFYNDDLKEILSTVDLEKHLIVNVHQAQTLNPELFQSKEITFDDAIKYDSKSIEDLATVVNYYKNQDKKVYVLGISFGAFMTQELIAEKGVDIADKYLIMVGRLNIEDVFWKAFSEGKNGYYIDGVTPVSEEVENIEEKNMYKLAAGLGHNRYMDKLADFDLSKVTYIYGKTDEQVGSLTEAEIKFLNEKNATVISTDGGHSETIDGMINKGLETGFGISK